MKDWLRETHGRLFELFRHFLLHFFDSDLITATGQTTPALIGVISVCAPWVMLIWDPLKFKYAHLSKLPAPGPYREALRADALWFIALVMGVMGLLTAIKWQALFPGVRDYRAMASLPIGRWRIFAAKCLAVLVLMTAAIPLFSLPVAMLLPAVSASHWALNPSFAVRVGALFCACAAGSYFLLAAMAALEAALLNLLPPRIFESVAGVLQGLLVSAMLILMVLSFSIQPRIANFVLRPAMARWLPPAWFLGLHQSMAGDPDPAMLSLAATARMALAIASVLAAISYLISYSRHRRLLVEGAAKPVRVRRWTGAVFDWLVPNPRQQAVITFIVKTMSGNGQHRMILMGYCGFGMALQLTGLIGARTLTGTFRFSAADFVFTHVVFLVYLVIGLRHVFAVPAELSANWLFRITEGEGRRDWMAAVDRLVIFGGATALVLIPLPLELHVLGWRAWAECGLFVLFAAACYEGSFSSWEKLPFTCSYLPGKTPAWILFLRLLGLLSVLPAICALFIASLSNAILYAVVVAILLPIWWHIHIVRRETWGETQLRYEEFPEPAIHSLELGK